MFHSNQRKEGMSVAIFGLWRNWTIAVGFLAILSFVSPLVKQVWLTPICLLLFFGLQFVRSRMDHLSVPVCSRLYKEVTVILLIICGVVICRNLLFYNEFELTGQPVNKEMPMFGVLISGPVTVLVTLYFMFQKKEPLVCQVCHVRHGNVIEKGFIGTIYRREWRYQTRLLCLLSLLLSIGAWFYYLEHYINVNVNKADYFIFLWSPLVLYVLSLIYLGWRYYSLWVFYCHNDEHHLVKTESTSSLRFIILSDNKIFLDIRSNGQKFANGQDLKKFETPAIVNLPYQERMDAARAAQLFKEVAGFSAEEVRRIYDSPDTVTFRNIFHYFAFLKSPEDVIDSKLEGEWFTLGEVRQLLAQKLISPHLASELVRIYNVAMAWKTYDREGRRLYKIKHYRPTFRFKDIRTWDVDYSDPHWLMIAHRNEDKRFFAIRKFLHNLNEKFHY